MGKMNAKILVCCAVALSFVAGLGIMLTQQPLGPSGALRSARGECAKKTNRTAFIACFRKALEPQVKKNGVQPFIQALVSDYESQGQPGSPTVKYCHDIAHSLGQLASRASGVNDALASCTSICGAGCYHGVVEGAVSEGQNITTLVTNLCTSGANEAVARSRWACFHGLGHGIGSFTGDIFKAIALCDRVADEDDKKNCDRGVFMELFQSGSFEHAAITPPEDVMAFCAGLTGAHAVVCYETVGLQEYTRTQNLTRAIAACDRTPASYADNCIGILGNMAYHEFLGDAGKIFTLCSQTPKRRSCLLGAVHEDVLAGPRVSVGKELCMLADSLLQKPCASYLGERVESIYGKETRTSVCESFPSELKEACIGGAL